jgi:hypothetical protein
MLTLITNHEKHSTNEKFYWEHCVHVSEGEEWDQKGKEVTKNDETKSWLVGLKSAGKTSDSLKLLGLSWMWWVRSAILVTQEAEIGRIEVQSQPGQKSLQDPILTNKNWALWHVPLNPATQETLNRRIMVWDPIRKISKAKRAEDMAQAVECLPSKGKTLSSKPSILKK